MITRLLLASKQAQPDIQVCVAFLCTRVKYIQLNKKDYKKLARVIGYLQETIHFLLIVGVYTSGKLIWNIDASFVVHPDYEIRVTPKRA